MKRSWLFISGVVHGLLFAGQNNPFIPEEKPDLTDVPPFYSNIAYDHREKQQAQLVDDIQEHVVSQPQFYMVKGCQLDDDMHRTLMQSFASPELCQQEISFRTKPVAVTQALELIGRTVSLNMVIDNDVTGRVGTFSCDRITPGALLQTLCLENDPPLALVKEATTWRVMTLKKWQQHVAHVWYDRVEKRSIVLEYVRCDEALQNNIDAFWHTILDGATQGTYLAFDDASRKIIARGPRKALNELAAFIRDIDCVVPQVRIDAIVILADRQYEYNFGINWSGIYNRQLAIARRRQRFSFVGLGGRLDDFATPPATSVDPTDFAFNLFTRGKDLIKLPFVLGGPDLNTRRLNLELNAAEVENKIKIVSRPSVLTYHNETAEILIGKSIPLQTIVEDVVEAKVRNVQTINFKDVGIVLNVKPQVNKQQDTIMLEIMVEDSEVEEGSTNTNDQGVLTKPPVIRTIRTKNKVCLRNGQTTIIGGLTFNKKDKIKNTVPFLRRLPLIGWLFRGVQEMEEDVEQLIFITPTLVI